MIGKFVSRILTAVFVILLANHLLPASFGIFNLAFAIAYITAVVIDFGFDEMAVREVSRAKFRTSEVLSTILTSRLLLCVLNFVILIVLYTLLVPYLETAMTLGILLLAGIMLAAEKLTGSFAAIFQAHERMDVQGITDLISKGVYLGFGFTGIRMGLDLKNILLLLLIAYLFHFFLSLGAYMLVIGDGLDKPGFRYLSSSIKTTMPFTVFVLLAVFYGHVIVLLLTLMEGDYATGVYSAGWKIVVFLGVIPYSFGRALYPVFSRKYDEGVEVLNRTYTRSMKYLLITGLPITIALYIITDDVLSLIYRAEFMATVPVFRTMVWMLPFLFMNGSLKIALWASDKTSEASLNLFLSSVTLVLTAVLLIPMYGVTGAAMALVLAEMIHFLLNYHRVSNFLEPLPIAHLWKPFCASVVMGAVLFSPIAEIGLLPLLTISFLVYGAVLYFIKGVDVRDLAILWSTLGKR